MVLGTSITRYWVSDTRYRVPGTRYREQKLKFCLGDFDEAAWRTKLQRLERDHTKKREITLVLEMIVQACGDLFRQMIVAAQGGGSRTPEDAYDDVCALLDHANTALCRVAAAFGCTVPIVVGHSRVDTLGHAEARDRLATADALAAMATE